MLRVILAALLMGGSALAAAGAEGEKLFLTPRFEVQMDKDIAYGEGLVDFTGKPRSRKLLMDVYRPLGKGVPAKRPALVLAFGGFWHRGGRPSAATTVSKTRPWPTTAAPSPPAATPASPSTTA